MDDLTRAFLFGFAVSREGFNGECAFKHLAPDDLTDAATDYRRYNPLPGAGIAGMISGWDDDGMVMSLAREAVAFIRGNPALGVNYDA